MNAIRRTLAFAAALALLGPGPSAAPRPKGERKDTVKGRLHIISSSHQDIAWMDSPEKCIVFRDTNCITPALAMMAKDPAYSFTMENMLNLAEYLERHPERAEEIGRLTREGRMEWGATYNQPYESLLTGESLIREAYFGRLWLKKKFPGADARVYFNPDVPGRAAQMPQILAKAGIPYMVMSRYHEGFYRWASPDGSSVLAYSPGHYGNAAAYLNAAPAEGAKAIAGQAGQVDGLLRRAGPRGPIPAPQFRRLLPADRFRPAHPALERRGGGGRSKACPARRGCKACHAVLHGAPVLRGVRRRDGQARHRHRRAAWPVALHPRPDPPLGRLGGARSRPASAGGRGVQHGASASRREFRELSGRTPVRRVGSRHLPRPRLGRQRRTGHGPPVPQEVRVRPGRGPGRSS